MVTKVVNFSKLSHQTLEITLNTNQLKSTIYRVHAVSLSICYIGASTLIVETTHITITI